MFLSNKLALRKFIVDLLVLLVFVQLLNQLQGVKILGARHLKLC